MDEYFAVAAQENVEYDHVRRTQDQPRNLDASHERLPTLSRHRGSTRRLFIRWSW